MTVRYSYYEQQKDEFFRKNGYNCKISEKRISDECYSYDFTFDNGEVWHEVTKKEYVSKEVEIMFCCVDVRVPLKQIKYWTNNSRDYDYTYEPWTDD